MKVKIPLGFLLIAAALLGYMLGTENGRKQRDRLLRKIRREEVVDEVIESVADAVSDAAGTESASTGD